MQQIDPALLKKIKAKVEEGLNKRELETIQYWLEELNKVYARHKDITTLQNALKELAQRMQNRIKVLKENL